MSRATLLALMLLASTGCGSGPKADATAARPTPAVAATTDSDAPQLIAQLTDQTTVFTCPKCDMDWDRAGQCAMCHVDLVETRIEYLCTADGEPVGKAGKCERCDMDAKIVKTAVVATLSPALTGN